MNKESVKINITCAGGRVEEVESDAIYGCAVTKEMCEGNTELEYFVLNQAIGVLAARLEELTGGNNNGGN